MGGGPRDQRPGGIQPRHGLARAVRSLYREVSGSSFGLGFETGYLLGSTNKKVVLLYRHDLEKRVSLLITGNTHPNCTLLAYSTVDEVECFLGVRLPRWSSTKKS